MFSLQSYENSYIDAGEQFDRYAGWFVRMRWMAVAAALLLIYISVNRLHLLPYEVWTPLMGAVALLAGLNAVYMVLIRAGTRSRAILLCQAYADLVILAVLLHYSGGIENPLALLTIFHVIIGGIILSRRQCFLIAATGAVLVAAVALTELGGLIPHYTLQVFPHVEEHGELAHAAHADLFVVTYVGLLGGILMLTAIFVTSVVERMRWDERELQRMTDRALTQTQTLEKALETTGTGLIVYDRSMEPLLLKGALVHEDRPGSDTAAGEVSWPIEGAIRPIEQTLEDGKTRVTEIPFGTEDENHGAGALQITTAPLRDKSGDISHAVQLVQDVTEQKLVRKKLIRAGKLAAVGELAGQVAHEVNNPIAIISAKARILLANHRDSLTDHTSSELEKIVQLSDRVALIAQGLLSYCRPSTARKERIDLAPPVRSAISMIRQKAESGDVRVVDSLPDSLEPVEANAHEVEQIFLNLLLNALDAMDGGGTLKVDAFRNNEGFEIRVSDTGSGIEREKLGRIFDPFYTTKPPGRGTGLGLSICLGLVRNFGGRIDVESEVGAGTTVSVWIPELAAQDDRTASDSTTKTAVTSHE